MRKRLKRRTVSGLALALAVAVTGIPFPGDQGSTVFKMAEDTKVVADTKTAEDTKVAEVTKLAEIMKMIEVIKVAKAAGYNVDKAVEYAHRYAYNYNRAYPDCNKIGGDCANFVSQCLEAGGLPQEAGWRPGLGSWQVVSDQISYLKSKGYPFIDYATAADIKKGNPVYYWDSSKKCWGHVGICVGADANGTPLVAAHNNNRDYASWKLGYSRVGTIMINRGTAVEETVEGIGPDEYKVTNLKDGDILSGISAIRGKVQRGGLYPYLELFLDYSYVSTTCNNQYGNFRLDLDTTKYADGYHKLGVKMKNQNGYDYTTWLDIYICNKKPVVSSMNISCVGRNVKTTVVADSAAGMQQVILCYRNRSRKESFTSVRMDEPSATIYRKTFNAKYKGVYDVHIYAIGKNGKQTVKCGTINVNS